MMENGILIKYDSRITLHWFRFWDFDYSSFLYSRFQLLIPAVSMDVDLPVLFGHLCVLVTSPWLVLAILPSQASRRAAPLQHDCYFIELLDHDVELDTRPRSNLFLWREADSGNYTRYYLQSRICFLIKTILVQPIIGIGQKSMVWFLMCSLAFCIAVRCREVHCSFWKCCLVSYSNLSPDVGIIVN